VEPSLWRFGTIGVFYNILPGDPAYGSQVPLAANSYTISRTFVDPDTNLTGTVSFTGHLTGSVGPPNVEIVNHFDGPTSQLLAIGRSVYNVTVSYEGAYEPVPLDYSNPNGPRAGYFFYEVDSVAEAPEPGGLTLAVCGLMGAAAVLRRWRRAAVVANHAGGPSPPGTLATG
jgi:hypothetical protein